MTLGYIREADLPDWVVPFPKPMRAAVLKAIPEHKCCEEWAAATASRVSFTPDPLACGTQWLGPDVWAQTVYDPKQIRMVDIYWVGYQLMEFRKPVAFCPWCGAGVRSWTDDEFTREVL